MSALARYYHSQGYIVAGYDRTPSPLTRQLENEGVAIHYEDNDSLLPALIESVIYTPAVPYEFCVQVDVATIASVKRKYGVAF